jgi:hypothetical protein
MTLLGLILMLVIVGLVLWLVNTYIPMAPPVKTVLNVVVVIILILWIASAFGGLPILTRPIR